MMKRLTIIAAMTLVGTMAWGQSTHHYDITIRRLNTAEQQLLYEQKRTIGLKKFEIDKQLAEIRRQKAACYRSRAPTTVYSNSSKSRRPSSYRRPAPYRPPEPDWKTIEAPFVTVKGTMMVDGRMAALVSRGQIVHSNEVFATSYQGETRYWRVREINSIGAEFDRVTSSGQPWVEPKPVEEKRSFFAAFFGFFDRPSRAEQQQHYLRQAYDAQRQADERHAEVVRWQREVEGY